jgi:hypothetical protein
MLTFQPLKTKALIIQGNIRRKGRFLNAGILSLNRRLKARHSMPTLKNLFDEMETENKRSWEISAVKKYCIILDYKQQSWQLFDLRKMIPFN